MDQPYFYISLDKIRITSGVAKTYTRKIIRDIADHITLYGIQTPLLLDEQLNVVMGHGYYLAAELIGLKNVPCIIYRSPEYHMQAAPRVPLREEKEPFKDKKDLFGVKAFR